MVQSKAQLFDKTLIKQAHLFKALSHPARLQILQYLAEINTCVTGDLSDELPLGRTTVNQHIKELKEVGLIKGTIDGTSTKYCLNSEMIKELDQNVVQFISSLHTCSSPNC